MFASHGQWLAFPLVWRVASASASELPVLWTQPCRRGRQCSHMAGGSAGLWTLLSIICCNSSLALSFLPLQIFISGNVLKIRFGVESAQGNKCELAIYIYIYIYRSIPSTRPCLVGFFLPLYRSTFVIMFCSKGGSGSQRGP